MISKNVKSDSGKQVGNIFFQRYLGEQNKFKLGLSVDATNDCQLSCAYCYFGKKDKRHMNVTKVFRAIVNMASVFSGRIEGVGVHYMGGEPLIAWDEILQLNQSAREYFSGQDIPFSWSMTSNLVALDEKKMDHMIKEKANIHCSVDGPADIHDRNRPFKNKEGSFSRIAKNIPLALRITPHDSARVTVRPRDAERMLDITSEMLGRGFAEVGLFPALGVQGEDWTKEYIENWQRGITESFLFAREHHDDKKIRTIIAPRSKERNEFAYCRAGKGIWAIDVDGKLYFCHHMTRQDNLTVIDAALASPDEIRFAIENSSIPPESSAIPESCHDCLALPFCEGACWSVNYFANGSAAVPATEMCTLISASAEAIGHLMQEEHSKRGILHDNSCTSCQSWYDCCIQCMGGCD